MSKKIIAITIFMLFMTTGIIVNGDPINHIYNTESNRNIATNNNDKPIFRLAYAEVSLSKVEYLNITGNEILKIPLPFQTIGLYLDARITGFSDGEYDTIRPGLAINFVMFLRGILKIPQYYHFEIDEYVNITCKYCRIRFFDETDIWFRAFDLRVYR